MKMNNVNTNKIDANKPLLRVILAAAAVLILCGVFCGAAAAAELNTTSAETAAGGATTDPTPVSDEAGLKTAVASENFDIVLTDNITLTAVLVIDKPGTIDGAGKSITFVNVKETYATDDGVIRVALDDADKKVTLKNLGIIGPMTDGTTKPGWKSYAVPLKAFGGIVEVDGVTIKGGNMAILSGMSTDSTVAKVVVKGNNTFENNSYDGINIETMGELVVDADAIVNDNDGTASAWVDSNKTPHAVPDTTANFCLTTNSSNKYTYLFAPAEAMIGTTYYATLADAIAAAQDTDTVKLLKDVALTDTLIIANSVTLDLDGHKISKAANADFSTKDLIDIADSTAAITVTITDGKKTGQIDGTNCMRTLVADNKQSATVLLKDLTIIGGRTASDADQSQCIQITKYGTDGVEGAVTTATIENCTITDKGAVSTATEDYDKAWNRNAVGVAYGATLTIKNSTITSENNSALVVHDSGGELNVESGTYSGKLFALYARTGTGPTYPGVDSVLNVKGGEFTGPIGTYKAGGENNAKIVISGGIFDTEPDDEYIADGYVWDGDAKAVGIQKEAVDGAFIPDEGKEAVPGVPVETKLTSITGLPHEGEAETVKVSYAASNAEYKESTVQETLVTFSINLEEDGRVTHDPLTRKAIITFTVKDKNGVYKDKLSSLAVYHQKKDLSWEKLNFVNGTPKWNDSDKVIEISVESWSFSPFTVVIVVEEPEAYTVTTGSVSHGSLSVTPTSAARGETITVTATPDAGYRVSLLTYTPDGGTAQTISGSTFTMPAANVTVNAVFKPKEEKESADPTGHAGMKDAEPIPEHKENQIKIVSADNVTGDVTFSADNSGVNDPDGAGGYTLEKVYSVYQMSATAKSGNTVLITVKIQLSANEKPENVCLRHYTGTPGSGSWDSAPIHPKTISPAAAPYTHELGFEVTKFSPFALTYEIPVKKSSSSPQGTSVWLTAEPTLTETPTPTPTPAPEVPQVKPVEQKPAAQTGASPAPVMGVLAGLGCAAVLFGLRRK